jgi:predicted metal-dependent HD superfamily phosphohydrolase
LIEIEKIRFKVREILKTGLSPQLSYHSYEHTCSVVENCLVIAANENISDTDDLLLLETAAWFHDIGFIRMYKEHEKESCLIARDLLPEYGASDEDIAKICEMIMATQIPQSPKNLMGEILCDADLDYLGRDDFPVISEKLREEWLALGIISKNEIFYERQLNFLNNHKYFTTDSQTRREPIKQKHLINLQY